MLTSDRLTRDLLIISGGCVVGAPRFELGTPSPPDWCANRAALRSDERRTIVSGGGGGNREDGIWARRTPPPSCPRLSGASRQGTHGACLSGMTGTSPAMTKRVIQSLGHRRL